MRLIAAALIALAAAPADAARPVAFAAEAPRGGALVLPLGSRADLASRGALDAASRAAIERALDADAFDYKARSTLMLRGIGPYSHLLVIGTGSEPLTGTDAAGHWWPCRPADRQGERARIDRRDRPARRCRRADRARRPAGGYRFDRYKYVDPAKPAPAGRQAPLTVIGNGREADAVQGRALAEAVNFARDLANEPANVLHPESFVERTREAFRGVRNVTITALDVPAMERLGMGSILSVGKGSARPPRMLIVEYRGAGGGAPVALAGKGHHLRQRRHLAQARRRHVGDEGRYGRRGRRGRHRAEPRPLAGAGQRGRHRRACREYAGQQRDAPGDVVKAMNGRTIEILNTDAKAGSCWPTPSPMPSASTAPPRSSTSRR
jgi:leucyl aminopeptidase